jgi:beta-N-acetylhexosaminidase
MSAVARLSLEEKVGQLFWIGFDGTSPAPPLARLLRDLRPGGLVLFSRNIESAAQVRALNEALAASLPVPPFLALDQEGGRVSRLRGILGPTPAAAALGSRKDADLAVRRFSSATARALRLLGFNVNFAPVLDLSDAHLPNGIGDRAFAPDPARVTALARGFARAHLAAGVLPVGKHFPGLGRARADTHVALPVIEAARAELWDTDLLPYRRLARVLPIVMTGHACYTGLQRSDREPASLAKEVIEGLLRRRIGYRGLILTDDLEMGAVDQGMDGGERALRALRAGNDGLMFCRSEERIREAHRALVEAFRARWLPAGRLEASVRRILGLKHRRLAGRRRARFMPEGIRRCRAAIAALGMTGAAGADPTARLDPDARREPGGRA